MTRLLILVTIVTLGQPSSAQAQVAGVDGPYANNDVRQWNYVETRHCTVIRQGASVQRVCRVERQGRMPAWIVRPDQLRDEIPRGLRRDELPGRGEVGTPARPRKGGPAALPLPKRDGPGALPMPQRDAPPPLAVPPKDGPAALPHPRHSGPPAIVLPPRHGVTPPMTPPTPPRRAVVVPPVVTPKAPARTATTVLSHREAQSFKLLNAERQRQGKSALRIDPRAVLVARAHSKDMCQRRYFDHRSPEGKAPWDRLRAGKVRFSGAGENIAVGYTTAAGAHRGWMNSPGHRRNRLNASYTRMGIGVYDCNGKPYWTEVFMK